MSDNLNGSEIEVEDTDLDETTVDDEAESEGGEQELQYIDLDGEEVSLDDVRAWKQGHMMQADYTRKTMDLSNQRKAVEGLTESLNSKIGDLDDKIQVLESSMDDGYTDDELDELFDTDPGQYRKIERARQKRRDALANAKSARDKAKSDLIPAEQQALLNAMPEWSGEKGQQTYENDAKLSQAYMSSIGFSQKEITELVDHRVVKSMILAARYQNLKNSKPAANKRVKPKTKPSKPGSKIPASQPKTLGQVLYGSK